MRHSSDEIAAVTIALLTVSDSRGTHDDTSGHYLHSAVTEAGHQVVEQAIVADNRYQIRAVVSEWIARHDIQVILLNGGTGFYSKNSTPEALFPLFDREIEGFGELLRMLSYEDIGSATIQSRALAGMANQTAIFAMPGSGSACRMAWEQIIAAQLDARTRPCNLVSHLKTITSDSKAE